jgi:hypothetical protein
MLLSAYFGGFLGREESAELANVTRLTLRQEPEHAGSPRANFVTLPNKSRSHPAVNAR